MNIELTDEQLNSQNKFREFADKVILPNAGQFDREEHIPKDFIKKIADEGYLGSVISKEFGGSGMDMVTIGLLNEEIGRCCSSVRSLLTVHGMVALAIQRWGTEKQKEFWLSKLAEGKIIGAFGLTEPDVGSDAKSINTTAVLSGNTYILNGKKKWTTMGQIADIFLIFANCEGKPTAFLVERNMLGLSVIPMKGLLGARASMIAEIHLDNCQIPEENILGSTGTGLSHVALSSLDYGRYTIAWGAVGIGQGCLEESYKYARKRKQFGTAIRQHQLIQKMITEMVVEVKAARLMCLYAAYLKDTGDPQSIMETWNAKYYSTKMAVKTADHAVQIHGGNGCCCEYPVERYYRDAKIGEIIEGTSQMHEVLIAINAFRTIT